LLPDTTKLVDPAIMTTPTAAAPRAADAPASEPAHPPPVVLLTQAQLVFRAAGVVAFLYFARPVALPIVLACVAGMTLKPLVRWLSYCRIPPVLGAAIVVGLLVTCVAFGSVQLGRPPWSG